MPAAGRGDGRRAGGALVGPRRVGAGSSYRQYDSGAGIIVRRGYDTGVHRTDAELTDLCVVVGPHAGVDRGARCEAGEREGAHAVAIVIATQLCEGGGCAAVRRGI